MYWTNNHQDGQVLAALSIWQFRHKQTPPMQDEHLTFLYLLSKAIDDSKYNLSQILRFKLLYVV